MTQKFDTLTGHFSDAAQLTARQQAETQVKAVAKTVAEQTAVKYGVALDLQELWNAAEASELPVPQTMEQMEKMLQLVALDIALSKKTGKPQPKPAPTVQKSTSAPAQAVKSAEPDVDSLNSFEDLYHSFPGTA